jgi:hypothetical protein
MRWLLASIRMGGYHRQYRTNFVRKLPEGEDRGADARIAVHRRPSAKPIGSRRIEVASASTEEALGSVPEAAEGDIDLAVAAARAAFDDPAGRASWSPARRGEALERFTRACKCPRSVDFRADLPRRPTGELFKRVLMDEHARSQGGPR